MSMRVDISSHRVLMGEQRIAPPTLARAPPADEKTQDVISKPDSPLPERRTSPKLESTIIVDAQIKENIIPSPEVKAELTTIQNESQKMVKHAETAQANRSSVSPPKNRDSLKEKRLGILLQPRNGEVLVTSAELQLREKMKSSSSSTSQQVSQEVGASKDKKASWANRLLGSPKLESRSSSTQKSTSSTIKMNKNDQDLINQQSELLVKINKLEKQRTSFQEKKDLKEKELEKMTSLNKEMKNPNDEMKNLNDEIKNINNEITKINNELEKPSNELKELDQQLLALPKDQQIRIVKSITAELNRTKPYVDDINEKKRSIEEKNISPEKKEIYKDKLDTTKTMQYNDILLRTRFVLRDVILSNNLDGSRDKDSKQFNQTLQDLDHGIIIDTSVTSKIINKLQGQIQDRKLDINLLTDSHKSQNELKFLNKLNKNLELVKEKHIQISNNNTNLNIINNLDNKTISEIDKWLNDNIPLNKIVEIEKKINLKERELVKTKNEINELTIKHTIDKDLIKKKNNEQELDIKQQLEKDSHTIENVLPLKISRLEREIKELEGEKMQQEINLTNQPTEYSNKFLELAKSSPDTALGILTNTNTNISYLQSKSVFLDAELKELHQAKKTPEIETRITDLTSTKERIMQDIKQQQQLLAILLPPVSKESEKIYKDLATKLYQKNGEALTKTLKQSFSDPSIKKSTLEVTLCAFQNSYELTKKLISPQDEKRQAKISQSFEKLQSHVQVELSKS